MLKEFVALASEDEPNALMITCFNGPKLKR